MSKKRQKDEDEDEDEDETGGRDDDVTQRKKGDEGFLTELDAIDLQERT